MNMPKSAAKLSGNRFMRQIVLDTETTGLEPKEGHRIIEIGCVEMIDRRLTGNTFHQYINPERKVDEGALAVHGISNEFLQDKPVFTQVVDDFIEFVKDSELVIHNAPFDIGFLNHELGLISRIKKTMQDYCTVLDTLVMAKKLHPGQRNNLDALCRRYGIDNTNRDLHGALLDSEILADVYLAMTGGQVSLSFTEGGAGASQDGDNIVRLSSQRNRLPVLTPNDEELAEHEKILDLVEKNAGESIWRKMENINA